MEKIKAIDLWFLIFYAAVMGGAQIILSAASREIGEASGIKNMLVTALSSYWLWAGLIIYVVAFIFWLFILFRVDIRVAYPIAISSVFFTALFQSLVQQNFPNFRYWIGLMFVVVGVLIMQAWNEG